MKKKIIRLCRSGIEIEYIQEFFSIMNCLEKNKIFIDYQCRQGICGVCRINILHGTVKYLCTPIAFLQKKEILPCCCISCSNLLELEL